jgi:carbamoyl-phosphate synthase large subunit
MEVEIDAVCDGTDVLVPGIFQHVEKAGVHSGDSMAMFPAPTLTGEQKTALVDYAQRIAKKMQAIGLINIQFVVAGDVIYVLEVNPRASRTVPIVSKVTKVPMVELAVRAQLGEKLATMGYGTGLLPEIPFAVVKAPVFSTIKLNGVDPVLGPEMKSTGEILGLGRTFEEAAAKAFRFKDASYPNLTSADTLFVSLADTDKARVTSLLAELQKRGIRFVATKGTAAWLEQSGILVSAVVENEQDFGQLIQSSGITLAFITATKGNQQGRRGFTLRGLAVQKGIPLFTAVETFDLYVAALTKKEGNYHDECEDIGTLSKIAIAKP